MVLLALNLVVDGSLQFGIEIGNTVVGAEHGCFLAVKGAKTDNYTHSLCQTERSINSTATCIALKWPPRRLSGSRRRFGAMEPAL